MSWQDDAMIEQDIADALGYMGEAEWRDMYKEDQDKILKKAKRAEYNKKWRDNNKDKMKKINRENAANWRSNNRDKYNEYHREWYRKKKANEVQNN